MISLCVSQDDQIREKAKGLIQEYINSCENGIDEFFTSLVHWFNYKDANEIILYFSLIIWICNIKPEWVGNTSKGFQLAIETMLSFIENDEDTKLS